MPIVVPAEPGSHLSQGDILRDVPIAVANLEGGTSANARVPFVLVVSRPCKALRDTTIVIAPVNVFKVDLAVLDKKPQGALDRTRRLLSGFRDGVTITPEFSDDFYLGTIEPTSGVRYAAKLTLLASAMVPEAAAERAQWVRARRVGRLEPDFRRDLHLRLSLTFARLGHDDFRWYSDADLELVINAGQTELQQLELELTSAKRAVLEREAAAQDVPGAMRTDIAKREGGVQQARDRLAPYLAERDVRRGGAR